MRGAPRAYLSRPSQRSRLDMTVSLPLNRQLTRFLVLSCWLYRRVVLPFPRATAEVARGGDTRVVESALVPLGRTTQGSRRPLTDRREGPRVRPGVRHLRSHLRVLVRPPRRLRGLTNRHGPALLLAARSCIFSSEASPCRSSSPPLYFLLGGVDVYFPLVSYRHVLSYY